MLALEDAESGEVIEIDTGNAAIRRRFSEEASKRAQRLLSDIRSEGVDMLELSTDAPYVAGVAALLQGSREKAHMNAGNLRALAVRRTPLVVAGFLCDALPILSNAAVDDIRDIRGPRPVASPWLVWTLIGGALLAAILAYVAWRRIKRRRKAPETSDLELALARLDAARVLMQPGRARAFSIEVSAVVREYIERRFRVMAAHRTTDEFLHDLVQSAAPGLAAHQETLGEFLQSCDLAKFGGWNLDIDQMGTMLENARRFIQSVSIAAGGCAGCRVPRAGRVALRPEPTTRFRRVPCFTSFNLNGFGCSRCCRSRCFGGGAREPFAAVQYSSVGLARAVARDARSRIGRWVWLLPVLGAAFLIVGLARPQLAHGRTEITANGIDIMLGLDVSGSMQAMDFRINGERVNRIDVVKSVVSKFIDERPDDRIGVVAFAGAPYLVSPLTLDHDWLRQNLDRLSVGGVDDGTAIGSAIATAVNRLRDSHAKSRIVILLTDGMNNSGRISPLAAAEAAKTLGVKVYTIAVGCARSGTDSRPRQLRQYAAGDGKGRCR